MWNPLYLSADLTLLRRMSNRKMRYLDKFSSIQAVYRLGYIKSFPTWGTWGWSQKIICLPRRCHRIVAQIISKRSFMSISLAVLPSAPYFKIARMKDGGELNVVFMVGDLAITGDAHSQSLVVSIFPPRELRCISRHLPILPNEPLDPKRADSSPPWVLFSGSDLYVSHVLPYFCRKRAYLCGTYECGSA